MKRGIQPQQVGNKVSTQFVGSCPAHILGHIGFGDSQTLSHQSQSNSEPRQKDQIAHRPAGGGLIDEVACHQRGSHLHTDGTAQDHSQQHHPQPLRPQIVSQQPPVAIQCLKRVRYQSIFFLSLKSVVDEFSGIEEKSPP